MKKIKPYNIKIKGIKTNSKEVKKNDLFVCIKNDEHTIEYIKEALDKKARAVIVSNKVDITNKKVIKVDNIYQTLYDLCSEFYQINHNSIRLIGVTGTDGKTTTATLINQILAQFVPCSYLGTNGFEMNNYCIKTKNTTPRIEDIMKHLKYTIKHKGKAMSMEVSSEGLYYHRCDGLLFDVAILTNITKDHLNTHKTIKNYVESKSKLFNKLKANGLAIINADDYHSDYIIKKCNANTITYGTKRNCNAFISKITENKSGIKYNLRFNNVTYTIQTTLKGRFNIFNLTAAILAVNYLGINMENIISKLNCIVPVKGRFEFFNFGQPYSIVLDYAHTINATKSILKSLRNSCKGNLIVVVGCAGGRDKSKRKHVGNCVCKFADFPIFTEDDPRYEDVNDIINDMTKLVKKKTYTIELKRENAIKKAFDMAKPNDIVAILGKGDDQYMAIKDRYLPYSDREVINRYFIKKEH